MNAPLGSLDRPNSYIGRSVPRPNAKRLLAGRGPLCHRSGAAAHAARRLPAQPLRPCAASSRSTPPQARAMPGVRLVATGEDLARICTPWTGTLDHFKGMTSTPQLPLPLERAAGPGRRLWPIVAESRADGRGCGRGGRGGVTRSCRRWPTSTPRSPPAPARSRPAWPTTSASAARLDTGGVDLMPSPGRACGGGGVPLRPPHRGDAGAAGDRRRLRSQPSRG